MELVTFINPALEHATDNSVLRLRVLDAERHGLLVDEICHFVQRLLAHTLVVVVDVGGAGDTLQNHFLIGTTRNRFLDVENEWELPRGFKLYCLTHSVIIWTAIVFYYATVAQYARHFASLVRGARRRTPRGSFSRPLKGTRHNPESLSP